MNSYSGLPDENGRVEIFQIHTAQMKKFEKLDQAVDLCELATRTRNFTGAEIESVVRSAQATAMNRLINVSSSRQCKVVGRVTSYPGCFVHVY